MPMQSECFIFFAFFFHHRFITERILLTSVRFYSCDLSPVICPKIINKFLLHHVSSLHSSVSCPFYLLCVSWSDMFLLFFYMTQPPVVICYVLYSGCNKCFSIQNPNFKIRTLVSLPPGQPHVCSLACRSINPMFLPHVACL